MFNADVETYRIFLQEAVMVKWHILKEMNKLKTEEFKDFKFYLENYGTNIGNEWI